METQHSVCGAMLLQAHRPTPRLGEIEAPNFSGGDA